jgi:hypothetical protein
LDDLVERVSVVKCGINMVVNKGGKLRKPEMSLESSQRPEVLQLREHRAASSYSILIPQRRSCTAIGSSFHAGGREVNEGCRAEQGPRRFVACFAIDAN